MKEVAKIFTAIPEFENWNQEDAQVNTVSSDCGDQILNEDEIVSSVLKHRILKPGGAMKMKNQHKVSQAMLHWNERQE